MPTPRVAVAAISFCILSMASCQGQTPARRAQVSPELARDVFVRAFESPSPQAKPWVYWYFMDGHITREGISADLEAMKAAGIGGAIFLTVDIGVPRGPVAFASQEWQEHFAFAVHEADRLGIEITLGVGPGWTGSGGPWVKSEEAMQHLVGTATKVKGGQEIDVSLEQPKPRDPFFGRNTLTPALLSTWQTWYRDVAVVAYPTPAPGATLDHIDELALYHRAPYSSQPGVRPYFEAPSTPSDIAANQCLSLAGAIDLTSKLGADGRLKWQAPPGDWTIYRFGRTLTGQTTRPAPEAGLGFECDKFSRDAIRAHLASFNTPLLEKIGKASGPHRGLTRLHLDSWEMSSQNWSPAFADEFRRRRGYDPTRYLPAMLGQPVQDAATSQRFLWDLRQTARELVNENHAIVLRDFAHEHGLAFSVEPYDMNPSGDLKLGASGDYPMGEFWSTGFGFESEFSVLEAVSVGHTNGQPIIGAEAFTADGNENWQQYPARMKAQTDWAFAAGLNHLVIHRFQHQPRLDQFPGMRMGPYGVHWDRTETWWPMVDAYHDYLKRCSDVLRQGVPVADVLYLAPEGAPHVFRPPGSAVHGPMFDRRGYNFDGCDPDTLIVRASVHDGKVVFPDGMSYRVLVLPRYDTMTPGLLRKIKQLINDGATVIGPAPRRSPSLSDQPAADEEVAALSKELWGDTPFERRVIGKGLLINDSWSNSATDVLAPAESAAHYRDLYIDYAFTARVLASTGIAPDFDADVELRYTHRRDGNVDLYFISNPSDQAVSATVSLRSEGRSPERWNPLTGERCKLRDGTEANGRSTLQLGFGPTESTFIVFTDRPPTAQYSSERQSSGDKTLQTIEGPWNVSFDPAWGGPASVTFEHLEDWSKRKEPGIRIYSGQAVYHAVFDSKGEAQSLNGQRLWLALGDVRAIARVKLNGSDLGVVWCPPWKVEVPVKLLRATGNDLEITVANLWINRLIGDAGLPAEQRKTVTTTNPYSAAATLQPSGLLGPVELKTSANDD